MGVDFGMDLVVTIELIEKKMGVLAMLEEECIVPKATDKTYLEKMMGKHLGKHKSFGKPKPAKKGKPEAHFEAHHYAGTFGYNVTGWLFKNKDPVNEAIIGMMGSATNAVVSLVFQEKDDGTKKKGASMMTISAAHRESLMKLMTNLHSTHPHFVRCIIPNEIKKSGHIDAPLVMHQLNCNGVLEGIRICMLGLPNKVPHADFMTRYSIVAPKIFADMAGDPKECAQKALVHAGMDPDSFRCGRTKIMFRAGMLSKLEEIREGALSKIFVKMQCQARRVLVHVTYQGKIAEKKGISAIQRNVRLYYNCRDWAWYQFYTMVKGEMGTIKKKQAEEERRKQMAEGLAKFQAALAQSVAEREAAEAANAAAKEKAIAVRAEMEYLGSYAFEQADLIKAAEAAADSAAASLASVTAAIDSERAALKSTLANTKATLVKTKDDMVKELANAKASLEGAAGGYQKLKGKAIALEADKTAMKGQVTVIADAIAALDKKAAAALVEKREMWSTISTIQSDITTSLARASYLEKEGFAVDPENVGALVKMHYKLHSYVTYKLKKGKKQRKMKDASSLEPWTRIPRPVLLIAINKAAITYHQPLFLTSQRKRVKMAVKNLCLSSFLSSYTSLSPSLLFLLRERRLSRVPVEGAICACSRLRVCARVRAALGVTRRGARASFHAWSFS